MTAEAMGKAIETDPQLVMPVRPRFLKELVTLPLQDGLLIEGTDEQQFLRGPAVANLLPRLLPMLDGAHTLDELSVASKLPARAIHNAVALLYSRGLVEDSAADPHPAPDSVDAETLAFLRRHVDVTRVNASGGQALDRLARAEIGVCAAGPNLAQNVALMMDLIRDAGASTVRAIPLDGDLRTHFPGPSGIGCRLVAVLVEGAEPVDELQRLDDQCAALGISWVRALVDPDTATADLGPYFERGETACYRCFAAANQATQERRSAGAADGAAPLHGRLTADLLATEVIFAISRIGPIVTRPNVNRWDLDTWETRPLRVSRRPGCARCRGTAAESDSEIATGAAALMYEEATAFPSRHLLDPKGHQVHYRAASLELGKLSKRYPSAEHIALPPAVDTPPVGETLERLTADLNRPPTERLTVARLASLLALTAGIERHDGHTRSRLRRWAPTGGNLGSVELYVAAQTVDGLLPGIYFYEPHEHALARIVESRQGLEVESLIAQATPQAESTDALIVLAAANHRVAHKYGPFSYRIVHLDAGVAMAQMQVAAHGLGLRVRSAARLSHQALLDGLDLAPYSEIVTGAVGVSGITNTGGKTE